MLFFIHLRQIKFRLKKLVLLAFVLVAGVYVEGQSLVHIGAQWKQSDTQTLRLVHFKQHLRSGKLLTQKDLTCKVNVTIREKRNDGYVVMWQLQVIPSAIQAESGFPDSAHAYHQLQLVFTTDGNGSFRSLENWQEVRLAYLRMLQQPGALAFDPSYSTLGQQLANGDKQVVEQLLIRELKLYHQLYGTTPNRKGGSGNGWHSYAGIGTVPVQYRTHITEVNEKQGKVKINSFQQLDVTAVANTLAKGESEALLTNEDLSYIKHLMATSTITDYTDFHYNTNSSHFERIVHRRNIKRGTEQLLEFITLEKW